MLKKVSTRHRWVYSGKIVFLEGLVKSVENFEGLMLFLN